MLKLSGQKASLGFVSSPRYKMWMRVVWIWIWRCRWVHVAAGKWTIVTVHPWNEDCLGCPGYTESKTHTILNFFFFFSFDCFPFYSTAQRAIVSRNSAIEVLYALSFHGQLALWFRVEQHVWPMRLFAVWTDVDVTTFNPIPGQNVLWKWAHKKWLQIHGLIFISV